jgi:hypothetical protein
VRSPKEDADEWADGAQAIFVSDPIHGLEGDLRGGEHFDPDELSSLVEIEDHVRLGFTRRTAP